MKKKSLLVLAASLLTLAACDRRSSSSISETPSVSDSPPSEESTPTSTPIVKYDVNIGEVTGATIKVDKPSAEAGETITLSIKVDNGYEFASLSLNDDEVSFTEVKKGETYTFVMPEKDVTVAVTLTYVAGANIDKLKSDFPDILASIKDKTVTSITISTDGNNDLDDGDFGTLTLKAAENEALVTDEKGDIFKYYGYFDDVCYSIDLGTSKRFAIDQEKYDAYVDDYESEASAKRKVDSIVSQYGLNFLFENRESPTLPWYGGSRAPKIGEFDVSFDSETNQYSVKAEGYYEVDPDSYLTNYVYAGEFVFDSSLTLVKASSDVKFYTVANWDAEGHKPVDSSKVYEEMKTEVKDIVFGTPSTVTKENSSIEVDDYFVSSIEGEPVLSGMTGKDSSGNPAFVVGDAPSLSTDTKYRPTSALNFTGLALTSCSDETALEEDWWTEKTVFAKEGTFTLYFGDVVNPKLVSATVTVLPKPKTVPYFYANGSSFDSSSKNGTEVGFDYETKSASIELYLDQGADSVAFDFYYGLSAPYDVESIAINNSNETAVEASIVETDDGADLVLNPKAVGEATITFKTDATIPASEADYASNTASITVKVLDKKPVDPAEEAWAKATAEWENTAVSGSGAALPMPSFDFTDVKIAQEIQGMSVKVTVEIYTELNNSFGYASTMLSNGYTWVAETDDSVSLSFDAYSVTVTYDETKGCVVVVFVG